MLHYEELWLPELLCQHMSANYAAGSSKYHSNMEQCKGQGVVVAPASACRLLTQQRAVQQSEGMPCASIAGRLWGSQCTP